MLRFKTVGIIKVLTLFMEKQTLLLIDGVRDGGDIHNIHLTRKYNRIHTKLLIVPVDKAAR